MDHLIQTITVYLLPVIFAITLHEAAHGYVARQLGDPTAGLLGRISLNPLRHIDPIGTVVVPMVVLFGSMFAGSGALMFGWAKPVPVNFANLRNPKRDMMWVALAGPASNLAMALGWALLARLLMSSGSSEPFPVKMADAGINVNLSFMLINLIPIPPLDGGRVAVSLLPASVAWRYAKVERFGFLLLMLLLIVHPFGNSGPSVLGIILTPLYSFFGNLISTTFALS
jgi:Zn-dependent protease